MGYYKKSLKIGKLNSKLIQDIISINKINECLEGLKHSSACSKSNCQVQLCQKMKRIFVHAKSCPQMKHCRICKQLIALLCYHSKYCQESSCPIRFCNYIKSKLLLRSKIWMESLQKDGSIWCCIYLVNSSMY